MSANLRLLLSTWTFTLGICFLTKTVLAHREEIRGRHQRSSFYWFQVDSVVNEGHQVPGVTNLQEKVRDGRPLTMVIIGGSNSAGAGLNNANQKYSVLVADWWNETFPDSKITIHDVTIGGSASDFFLFCLQNYLPSHESQGPDIVLVELAVNDYGYKYGEAAQPMELLTRRLLSMPSKPLVVYVNFVSQAYDFIDNVTTNTDCLNAEDLGYDKLAEYYGIPSLSIKDLTCPLISGTGQRWLNTSANGILSKDNFHVGVEGNRKMASLMVDYFKKLIHLNDDKFVLIQEFSDDPDSLPDPLFSELSINDDQLTRPKCWSHLSPNFKIPLTHTLDANVIESHGFKYVSLTESKIHSKWNEVHRMDAYGGWTPDGIYQNPSLKIHFYIPESPNTVSHSIAIILRLTGGRDLFASFTIDGQQKTATQLVKDCGQKGTDTYVFPLATNVSPGNHNVTIESTLGMYIISGLALGYPEYSGYHGYRPISVKHPVWS